MKIFVIGCGSIGQRHIRNLIRLGVPASDIFARDVRTDAVAQLPRGVHVSGDGEEIPTDAPVLICTPAWSHALFVRLAIHGRRAFFVEKPATLGVSELTADQWQTDVAHLVACPWRFTDQAAQLRAFIGERRRIRLILTCQGQMRTWPGESYGPPAFEFCHEVDLACWLAGQPFAFNEIDGITTSQDVRHGLFRCRDGFHADIALNPSGEAYGRSWRAEHADEANRVDDVCEFRWTSADDVNAMHLAELAHFLRVVRGEVRSCNTLADARQVIELCADLEAALPVEAS